jgi:hypothetical protein
MPRGNISAARVFIILVSGSSHDSIEGIPSKLQTSKVMPSEWAKQTMYVLEKFSRVSYEGYELNIPVSMSSYEQEALDLFSAIESRRNEHSTSLRPPKKVSGSRMKGVRGLINLSSSVNWDSPPRIRGKASTPL